MSTKELISTIDVGSNAIRMVIAEKISPTSFHVRHKLRFPIRLGEDVFASGMISTKNLKATARAFERFKELLDENNIKNIKAVGTSALREAKNGQQYVEFIFRKSKIRIEIIDGLEEARLIHRAVSQEIDLQNRRVLLIDIGGGSVELTFSENGVLSSTQSFPFGTVRTLLELKRRKLSEKQLNIILSEYIKPLAHFLHENTPTYPIDFAVGTGGNLEALGKLKSVFYKKNSKNEMTYDELSQMMHTLGSMSYSERISHFQLRPDRADVILPAGQLTLTILRQCSATRLLIPGVGLINGILS